MNETINETMSAEDVMDAQVEYDIKPMPKELSKDERMVVRAWLQKIQASMIAATQNDRLASDPLGQMIYKLIDKFEELKAEMERR